MLSKTESNNNDKTENKEIYLKISDDNDDNEIIFSFIVFIKKLKKYLPVWIAFTVLSAFITLGYSFVKIISTQPELTALISFSYNGIEQGLDPNGRKFDINTVKSPAVIEMALTELNIDMKELENVRNAISFKKIMPQDTYNKLTMYNNILEKNNGNVLEVGEKILETSYFPTQFTAVYDQSMTSLSSEQNVDLFNKILEKYDDYFYRTYGYNETFGNAVSAVSYTDYDYAEAIDVFSNSLRILKGYVKQLAGNDETRFRSSVTGYTLADIYSSIDTVQSIDLDTISSYINRNNVTKNRDKAITYTEYRIEALLRQKSQYEKRLDAYDKSIEKYEKDQVLVFGGAEDINAQSNIASEQYDKMFSQKNSVADSLAETEEQIEYYQKRLSALKSNTLNSAADIKEVESSLADLNEKVNELMSIVCETADDYYRNVTFCNAYNILVPASNSASGKISLLMTKFKMPVIIIEILGIIVYFMTAFISTMIVGFHDSKSERK